VGVTYPQKVYQSLWISRWTTAVAPRRQGLEPGMPVTQALRSVQAVTGYLTPVLLTLPVAMVTAWASGRAAFSDRRLHRADSDFAGLPVGNCSYASTGIQNRAGYSRAWVMECRIGAV